MKILIVDDEELIVRSLQRIIKSKYESAEIITFTNPLEVIEAIKYDPNVDIIVSDVVMPEMLGTDMIANIRKISSQISQIKVIFMSGWMPDNVKIPKHDIFIEKPTGLKKIFNVIDTINANAE